MLSFQSFGGAGTVTGSRHLVEFAGRRLLLDCGLFQGHRNEARVRNRDLGFDPRSVDAILLSHAHIDHSGALPAAVKAGYRGPIYATAATRDLCEVMLLDSAYIQEADADYLNRDRQGKPPIEPLYTADDAREALRLFQKVPYDRSVDVGNGVQALWQEAGHILGSAGILVERDGTRVFFTGDVGRRDYPILKNPKPAPPADFVVSESTYGGREHDFDHEQAEETLMEVVRRVVKNRGRLIIPAFAVGRTQNLVYALAEAVAAGRIPAVPIFVDSPMAARATEVFRDHPRCYDRDALALWKEEGDLFVPAGVRFLGDVRESKRLNHRDGPFLVIASSGMAEFGRVVHHLKQHIADTSTEVLLVGYAARHTLARRLRDGAKSVRILGRELPVRARVTAIDGFSAHADRKGLRRHLEQTRTRAQNVFLVHGDAEQSEAFAEHLREEGFRGVACPAAGERYEVL